MNATDEMKLVRFGSSRPKKDCAVTTPGNFGMHPVSAAFEVDAKQRKTGASRHAFAGHTRFPIHRLILLLASASLIVGCHKEPGQPAKENLPTANVQVVKAVAGKHTAFEQITGTVVPLVKSTLEAKIVGRVTDVSVQSGQAVKAGEVVVKIEAPEIQAQAERAKAALKLAEQESQRVNALFAKQAATRSELDAATSHLTQARAALDEVNVMLSYLAIAAPFDGVVSRKLADVGDLAAPGKPLIEVEKPGSKRFEAAIPEALIDKIKVGEELNLKLADVSESVSVKVAEINPAGDPVSRSWLVKFDLPDGANVRSGAFGRVAVPRDEVTAVTAPASTVLRRGQLEQVFVVAGGHISMRLVKTGRAMGNDVEILSGLNDGETVVSNPTLELRDSQPVNVR